MNKKIKGKRLQSKRAIPKSHIPKSAFRNLKSPSPKSKLQNRQSINLQLAALRKEVEEILKSRKGIPDKIPDMDFPELLNEFLVYQAELETQNEKLRSAHQQLEESQNRCADLYDFAPVGYFTFDKHGKILEANLAGSQQLSTERRILLKRPFSLYITEPYKNIFFSHLEKVFETVQRQTCELKLIRKDGSQFYAHFESIAVSDNVGNYSCRSAISDITKQKQAEEEIKRFASFPQLNPNPILEVDSSGVIIFSNVAAVQTLRKLNIRDTAIFLPDDINDILKDLKKETEAQFYREIKIKDRIFGESLHLTPQFRSVRIYVNDITESRQAEEVLQKSEEYYRLLMENASDAVTILERDGIIRYESLSVERMLGYKPEELVGMSAFDLIHPDDVPKAGNALSQLLQRPELTLYTEFRYRHKEGSWRILGATARNLLSHPVVKGVIVNSRDITESMQAEETVRSERQRLINILDSMVDGVYIVNRENEVEYVNPLIEKEYGPVNGRKCHEYFEGRKKVCTWCKNQEVFKGKTVRAEWYSEKTSKIYDLINTPLKNPDGSISKLGIFRDITERRSSEKVMRESEEKFRTIFDNSKDGILIADVESKEFLTGNNAICGMLGYSQDEIKNLSVTDIHPQEDLPRIEKRFEEMAHGEAISIEDVPVKRKDGSIFYADISSALITLTGEKYIVGSFRDITERRHADAALRESEDRFRQLVDVGFSGVAITKNTRFIQVSDGFAELFGRTPAEMYGMLVDELVAPEYLADALEKIRKGYEQPYESVCLRKDGSRFPVEVCGKNIRYQDCPARITALRDITARKRAEEELHKLNRTLVALSKSSKAMLHAGSEEEFLKDVCEIVVKDCSHAMVWIGFAEDDEGKTVRPAASAGFENGYLETLNITWADTERGRGPTGTAIRTGMPSICKNMLTDPTFKPWREEAIRRGYASSIVLPLIADGKAFGTINIYSREPDPFTKDEVKLLSELAGDLVYGILAMRSKEAHAKAEEAMRKSEKRYRSLFNNMTEGFAIHEIITDDNGMPVDYRFLDINPSFERLTGLSRDNVLGKTVKEVLTGIEPQLIENYGRVALSGEPSHFESYATAFDRKYEVFAYCNAPRQFAVIFIDVTERKKAELALRESEARLNRSQEVAHLGSWELDVVSNHLIWSDEVYRIFGLQPQEFAATYDAFLEVVHPEDRAAVNAAYSDSISQGKNTYEIEHRIIRRLNGEIRIVQEKCDHFRDSSGRIVRSVGMVLDITERKRMEEDLRKSRDELEIRVIERTKQLQKAYTEIEAFFESSLTPFVFLDGEFNFLRVNEAYAKCCARDISEFKGHNLFELYPDEENEAIFREVVKTKTPYQAFAKAFTFPDHPEWGVTYWDWTLTPILDFRGKVDFLVFALNDVTERKQAETELKEHEELLTTVLENLPVGVWTLDREGNISHWNTVAQEIWGGSRYVGINGFGQYKGWWLDTGKPIEPNEWGAARAIQKGKTSLNEEIEIECFDGTHKIILHSAIPLFDAERNITGAVVVNQDITGRKKAEETIKFERQRFYSVLEKLPAFVYLLNPDYTFTYVNKEFKKLFGNPGDRKCHEYLFNCQEPCEGCQTYRIFTEHKDAQQWEWAAPNGNTYAVYDHAFSDVDGRPLILAMGLDITERKRVLDYLSISNKLLEFFVTTTSQKEYLSSVVDLFHDWTGCNCIGIRVLDNRGNIPYESYTGFSNEFWEAENWISVRNDQCTCARVVLQKPDPQEMSMITPNGSFYCNKTAEFEQSLTEKELSRYRRICILTGYKSIAIVPIHYRDRVIGAVHIADQREGMVPLEKVEFIESLIPLLGEAMSRFSAEEALASSEARLSEAERIGLLGNWEWDIGNDIVSLSDQLYRIFDLKREEFYPSYESFMSLVHPYDFASVKDSIRKAVREKKPFDMNFRFMRKDGVFRTMHCRGEITYDLSGRPLLVRGTAQDITERIEAENALRESEERYRMLVETMNEGLEMDDENGLLIYANERLCEILGYSIDEMVGSPIWRFFDEKNQKIRREEIEKRKNGENEPYRLQWIKKDGQKIVTLVSPKGIFDLAGKFKGSFAVITDITERLRLESIAEAVNTMDNIGFIFSGVRHEIGNPINSIKMALSVLKQNLDSYSKEMIREYAERMLSEIQRMEYLLKAMKSFNLFETLEMRDVNVTTFIDDFLRLTSDDFAKKGIRIETDIRGTLWAYIDPRAFHQVLLNVMTNASDALVDRENATIAIRVLKLGDMINITIEDNGCGMSEEQVHDLFKPFYTTKEKGTGLGLVISKKMMTKMKGLIEVVSEKDKGTIVDLFVPEGIDEEE